MGVHDTVMWVLSQIKQALIYLVVTYHIIAPKRRANDVNSDINREAYLALVPLAVSIVGNMGRRLTPFCVAW